MEQNNESQNPPPANAKSQVGTEGVAGKTGAQPLISKIKNWWWEFRRKLSELGRQIIREEDGIHKQWYEEARKVRTPYQLYRFVRHLRNDYVHDYGTIVHAVTAATLGAAWCVNREPFQGGITGFQASAVMWEFIGHWAHKKSPMRLMEYDEMLYPSYAKKFEPVITKNTWKYLQKRADELIKEHCNGGQKAHPNVIEHWKSIAERGEVPFGFRVEAEL